VYENRALRRIFKRKVVEITEGLRKIHDEELHKYSSIKENEMGGEFSTHDRNEKCIQHFNGNTWREETTGGRRG
jgi:hypothetical protein